MTSTASPLATLAKESGTTFILALFVDLTGKPCAKLVPVEAVEELAREGVGFAGYAAGAMGQEPKDPDIMAIPDPASFTPVPFVKEGLALVHCDPHVEGEPWRFAPRVILRRMIERAAERDLSVYLGAEIEYFLVAKDERGALVTADPSDSAARPCYDARGVTRMFDHLASVSTAMNQLGWGNYANDHEDGNGQFEQNFDYADVLTTADRVITARYLISMLAEQRGMTATFMPKPFGDRTGSGLHMHLSLWKDDEPLFPAADDPRGLGLSELAYQAIAGVLEHASALQALVAPTVNSYKRTGAVATTSGASWAPRVPTYGGNDRTHLVRVPDGNRIELRGGDAVAGDEPFEHAGRAAFRYRDIGRKRSFSIGVTDQRDAFGAVGFEVIGQGGEAFILSVAQCRGPGFEPQVRQNVAPGLLHRRADIGQGHGRADKIATGDLGGLPGGHRSHVLWSQVVAAHPDDLHETGGG